MLNNVVLIGRLASDPELRYTSNGIAVANFPLAVQRPYTNQQGDKDVDFIDIVTWRKTAETCANHLGKGRLVAVEGRIQTRSYDDRQGVRRKSVEIVASNVRFLDWPKDNQQKSSSGFDSNNNKNNNNNDDFDGFDDDIEVPF